MTKHNWVFRRKRATVRKKPNHVQEVWSSDWECLVCGAVCKVFIDRTDNILDEHRPSMHKPKPHDLKRVTVYSDCDREAVRRVHVE